jgi:hypothetical protein
MKRHVTLMAGLLLTLCSLDSVGQEPGTNYDHLKSLDVMVGEWNAIGKLSDGTVTEGHESDEWILNKNFLKGVGWYRVGEVRVNYHFIMGWDPASKKIQMWAFGSDGANNLRTWSFEPGDKVLKGSQKGVGGDGKPTSANVSLSFVDANTFVISFTDFKFGDTGITNLEVKFSRVPKAK